MHSTSHTDGDRKVVGVSCIVKGRLRGQVKYLCAWGNDAASEVLTEARLLLVENYFQTPSSAWA